MVSEGKETLNLDKVLKENPLSKNATNIGYDREAITNLAKFNYDTGLSPSVEQGAKDVIKSLNNITQKETKTIKECFSLFNGKNGDHVINLLKNNGHIDRAMDLDLSSSAKIASYNSNHLVSIASNAVSLSPDGTKNINFIFAEAKKTIEDDAIKINEGTSKFEGFPLFDSKFKNEFSKSLDSYMNNFNFREIDVIKKDIASFDHKLSWSDLNYDKVKELVQGGTKFEKINEISNFSTSEIKALEKHYMGINKTELMYQQKMQDRFKDLRSVINNTNVDAGFSDIIKVVNKTSKSATQADANLNIKAMSGSVNAIKTIGALQNLGKKMFVGTVKAISPSKYLTLGKALGSGLKGFSSFGGAGLGAVKIATKDASHNAPTVALQAMLHATQQATMGVLYTVKAVAQVTAVVGKFIPYVGGIIAGIGAVATMGTSAAIVALKASHAATSMTMGAAQKIAKQTTQKL